MTGTFGYCNKEGCPMKILVMRQDSWKEISEICYHFDIGKIQVSQQHCGFAKGGWYALMMAIKSASYLYEFPKPT